MLIEDFEIMPNGEVFCGGGVYSKRGFVELFDQWLDSADPGEYELENLTMNKEEG
jgi:hypothetical protein